MANSARALADDADLAGFEAFADRCDGARTPRQVRALLELWAQRHGFRFIVLASHGHFEEREGLSVRAHNLPERACADFFGEGEENANPLFRLAEAGAREIAWRTETLAPRASEAERAWLARMARHGLSAGVTQAVRASLTPASCTLGGEGELDRSAARTMLRAGAYAFRHIVTLQRPRVIEADQLTARERECMRLAAFSGLRPGQVAKALGVSINTVRTMRQRAYVRLGARSQEEALWRMVTTGQLFAPARGAKDEAANESQNGARCGEGDGRRRAS